jgi:hypothetical protein
VSARFALAALLLLTAACASPVPLEQLQTAEPGRLADAVARCHQAEARAELERRGLLSAKDVASIDAAEVRVGMSALALRCVMGPPRDVSSTVGGGSAIEQWVYGTPGLDALYFYLRDGRLEAWQT